MTGAVLFCLVSSCMLAVSMSVADCLEDVLAESAVQPSFALSVEVVLGDWARLPSCLCE